MIQCSVTGMNSTSFIQYYQTVMKLNPMFKHVGCFTEQTNLITVNLGKPSHLDSSEKTVIKAGD